MKKVLLSLMLLCIGIFVNAQSDTTLQQYTGKYTFSGDSPVKEISVVVENGVLMATSAMGNAELKKTDTKDAFEITGFGGVATFRRNEEGKIIGVTLEVQGTVMEGTKSEGYSLQT